jgi:transposase-like protein
LIATGKPICRQQEKDKSLSSYEYTEGKPTCKKCLHIFFIETGYTYEEYEAQKRILDTVANMPLVTEIKLA